MAHRSPNPGLAPCSQQPALLGLPHLIIRPHLPEQEMEA